LNPITTFAPPWWLSIGDDKQIKCPNGALVLRRERSEVVELVSFVSTSEALVSSFRVVGAYAESRFQEVDSLYDYQRFAMRILEMCVERFDTMSLRKDLKVFLNCLNGFRELTTSIPITPKKILSQLDATTRAALQDVYDEHKSIRLESIQMLKDRTADEIEVTCKLVKPWEAME